MNDKNMHISVDFTHDVEIPWIPISGKKSKEGLTRTERRIRGSIDLSKDSPQYKINQMFRTLIAYNPWDDEDKDGVDANADKDVIIQQMCSEMEQRKMTLPGGIHFEGDGKHVFCGCCSGTEMWFEMVKELKNYESPWMGHDPNVSFREVDGICYIADVNLSDEGSEMWVSTEEGPRYIHQKFEIKEVVQSDQWEIIAYQPEEFHACLDKLDGEFADFVAGPLKKCMEEIAPEYAERFCEAFVICFRREDKWDEEDWEDEDDQNQNEEE